MNLDTLLGKMWKDYVDLNPQAQKIVELLEKEGEKVVNDHIALRTFDHPRVNIDVLARPFLQSGYKEGGEYTFPDKKLYAKHYEHSDSSMPKVFISQLETGHFSQYLQDLVDRFVGELSDETIARFDFTCMGRPWAIASQEYEKLKTESDYAAWVGAIGFRPNHFTIFINELKKYSDIRVLNQFLKESGIKLNDSGGEIKGDQSVCLEQSSTLANNVEVQFSDKKMVIPSCYFEFAKRYPMQDGKLYQGFVAKSADKIFESTDRGQD